VRRFEAMDSEATREGVNLRELSEEELLRRFRAARHR
jgi:hypothetical protein